MKPALITYIDSGIPVMRLQWSRLLSSMLVLGGFVTIAAAQIFAPSSGEITVKLVEGFDSAKSQPGTASHAVVTKSTNPAIPKNAPAVVQLGVDPSSGGLSVRLVEITVSGQKMKTASTNPVLAGGLIPGLNGGLNKLDKANPIVLAGPHVFVPGNTIVKFTLIEPGTQAASAVAQPQKVAAPAPEPPNVWQPTKPPFPGDAAQSDTAVSLSVIANNGAKHGRAHVIVSCTNKNFLSVHLTIAQALLGYKVDDFTNATEPGQTDADAKAQLQFDGTTTALFPGGNSGDDSPVHLTFGGPKNGFPDSFFTTANTGKLGRLTLLPPDGKGSPTIADFTTPADSAPLMAVASGCLATQAAEEAERKAKIIASCPAKDGKALVEAKVRRTPVSKPEFDVESSEAGSDWDLTSHPLKAGQHAVLDCVYTAPGAPTPKIPSPPNRVSITLPANAASCNVGGEPFAATCSRK